MIAPSRLRQGAWVEAEAGEEIEDEMIDDAIAQKILETAISVSDGYRRNISTWNTDAENDTSEKCARAASNTGFFILESLGYSSEQIREMKRGRAIHRSERRGQVRCG